MSPDRRPQRILAVKLADLGDVLLCEPAFRSLRTANPDARIDALVPPPSRELVPLLGLDLGVVTFPKYVFDDPRAFLKPRNTLQAVRFAAAMRRGRYDLVVLFHHLTLKQAALKYHALSAATGARSIVGLDNGRGTFLTGRVDDLGYGARHESSYMLEVARAAGGADVSAAPRFPTRSVVTNHDLPTPYAVLFPATGPYSSAREWPPERYAELARSLSRDGVRPVVVGAGDAARAAACIQRACHGAIDLTAKTTLPELAGVIAGAAVVIGGDTFPGHLAAALGRPLVSIFGPTNVAAWKPMGATAFQGGDGEPSKQLVVHSDLPCQPCLYTGFRLGRREGCPARTCIHLVAVADVLHAVRVATGAA